MYNILICDDEQDIVNALKIYLSGGDYCLFEASNGREALEVALGFVVVFLLPWFDPAQLDGIAATAKLREKSNVPIILLTAKSESSDKVLGLNIGADDYITKPFDPVEVLARVRSQLRRYLQLGGGQPAPSAITVGAVTIDDDAKRVTVDGEPVSLTPREYDILKFLMQHAGKVFSPQEIYRRVWREVPGSDNPVAVHVRHIREKIEINPAEPRYLKVVWGKGYKMEGAAQ